MTVFTDGIHLGAETLEELHAFARKIGLKREWFQNKRIPHYDLLGWRMVKKALENGARMVENKRSFVIEVKKIRRIQFK